ncbi:MAG: zinc ABC transporter substrate-binding protein, partial [Verrucomicrobia bacterium]|nr:zinc ABC transporter substrate-binding protein [Verrucomicrobiota bacterium]
MLRACVISFFFILATILNSSAGSSKLKVVSFSTILTEICENVGADNVDVVGLVKSGQDPHEYQPTPKDLAELSDAKLILLSGKHIE